MDKVVPLVAELTSPPHACAVYPHLDHNHPKGYFILGRYEFPTPFGGEPHIHDLGLSVEAAQQICKDYPDELGVVDKTAHTLALAELELLRNENQDLKHQMAEYDRELDAIHTIKGRGYSVQKKPGRKPNVQKAA